LDARPRRIVHYLTADGKDPFDRWIKTLGRDPVVKKVLVRIDRAEDGNFGDCRAVGQGVWELKIDFGPGYRIYCAEDGEDLILLKGGSEATQDSDIATAKEYWSDYNA
jgi:putative addiction module killer protein